MFRLSRSSRLLQIVITMLALSGSLGAATYKILYNFGLGRDGSGPGASVTLDSHGNLFGTTIVGGAFGDGTVFELSYSPETGWAESLLHSFNYQVDGYRPDGTLVFDGAGNLYGTTPFNGPQLVGTVYELSPNGSGWDFTLLYDEGTHGGVILDKAGNVYAPLGAGQFMGGAIGELSPGPKGWSYSALYSFCFHRPQCVDGIEPQGPLAWDAAGNLYGNTLNGGIYKYPTPCPDDQGCGLVFQMRPVPGGAWSYRVLHWFGAFVNDGLLLNGGLVVDGKGNVYGSTAVGGATGTGTVFELSPQPQGLRGQSVGYSETQVYTFPDCSQGCGPFGPVVRDSAGNLYGAAGGGNTSCGGYCGVVYRLSPQRDGTWKYTALHKFNGSDGTGPNGVTVGSDGNLYGTTIVGGQYNRGVVFEITP
jgi:uncharacterized repeat protein (TIGR03803 family)